MVFTQFIVHSHIFSQFLSNLQLISSCFEIVSYYLYLTKQLLLQFLYANSTALSGKGNTIAIDAFNSFIRH